MEDKDMINADEFFKYTADIIYNSFKLMQAQLEEDIRKAADLAVQKYIQASESNKNRIGKRPSKYIRGYKGLCEYLHISQTTAWRLKKENKIPYIQRGKILLFDPEEVKKSLDLK